jgi:hypothetical protein
LHELEGQQFSSLLTLALQVLRLPRFVVGYGRAEMGDLNEHLHGLKVCVQHRARSYKSLSWIGKLEVFNTSQGETLVSYALLFKAEPVFRLLVYDVVSEVVPNFAYTCKVFRDLTANEP